MEVAARARAAFAAAKVSRADVAAVEGQGAWGSFAAAAAAAEDVMTGEVEPAAEAESCEEGEGILAGVVDGVAADGTVAEAGAFAGAESRLGWGNAAAVENYWD